MPCPASPSDTFGVCSALAASENATWDARGVLPAQANGADAAHRCRVGLILQLSAPCTAYQRPQSDQTVESSGITRRRRRRMQALWALRAGQQQQHCAPAAPTSSAPLVHTFTLSLRFPVLSLRPVCETPRTAAGTLPHHAEAWDARCRSRVLMRGHVPVFRCCSNAFVRAGTPTGLAHAPGWATAHSSTQNTLGGSVYSSAPLAHFINPNPGNQGAMSFGPNVQFSSRSGTPGGPGPHGTIVAVPSPVPGLKQRATPPLHPGNGAGARMVGSTDSETLKHLLLSAQDEVTAVHPRM